MTKLRVMDRLAAWHRWAIAAMAVAVVAFGALTLRRSAYSVSRMTDASVYFRAGWAVRTGADPYAIVDDNGSPYLYPPTLAVLMAPLADPPPGASRAWMLPYPVTVVLWHAVGVLCLALSAHWLATALEESSPDERVRTMPRGCQLWWADRIWPLAVCITGAGSTLSRGQVNSVLLMLLSGMILAAVRGRPWRAGLWLGGAVCLKLIPAFLLLYPLWRRDWRWLGGCGIGVLIGLLLIPGLALGARGAVDANRRWAEVMLLPSLGLGDDRFRASELEKVTDNESLMAVIHNTIHADEAAQDVPTHPTPAERGAHWLLGGLFTAATLGAARPGRRDTGLQGTLFIGLLIAVMLMVSPMCHLHYFVVAMPLVAALRWAGLSRSADLRLKPWMWGLLALYFVGNTVPRIPDLDATRYLGMAMYTGIGLWGVGVVVLWRLKRETPLASGAGSATL